MKILLAEDHQINRKLCLLMLEEFGARADTAENGKQGGMALYTQVEDRLPTLARRFVFVSGDTQEQDTRAFLELVGCPVLPKPFDVQLLIEAVTEILERPAPAGG